MQAEGSWTNLQNTLGINSTHSRVHSWRRGAFKDPGKRAAGPEVTLFISPPHVVRAGSDARGPGSCGRGGRRSGESWMPRGLRDR